MKVSIMEAGNSHSKDSPSPTTCSPRLVLRFSDIRSGLRRTSLSTSFSEPNSPSGLCLNNISKTLCTPSPSSCHKKPKFDITPKSQTKRKVDFGTPGRLEPLLAKDKPLQPPSLSRLTLREDGQRAKKGCRQSLSFVDDNGGQSSTESPSFRPFSEKPKPMKCFRQMSEPIDLYKQSIESDNSAGVLNGKAKSEENGLVTEDIAPYAGLSYHETEDILQFIDNMPPVVNAPRTPPIRRPSPIIYQKSTQHSSVVHLQQNSSWKLSHDRIESILPNYPKPLQAPPPIRPMLSVDSLPCMYCVGEVVPLSPIGPGYLNRHPPTMDPMLGYYQSMYPAMSCSCPNFQG